jgi:hypothetical protein
MARPRRARRVLHLACQPPTPLPGSPPVQREPQEVEGGRTFALLLPQRRSLEWHQASLVRVESQPLALHPQRQHLPHALGIIPTLETDDEVIGVADEAGFTPQTGLHLLCEPPLEHVVQVDVAQPR